eukprot:1096890-Prorocentrum_minimum.AAC.1
MERRRRLVRLSGCGRFVSVAAAPLYFFLQLGKVAPRNSEWRSSLLDRAVLDFCPPGSGGQNRSIEQR